MATTNEPLIRAIIDSWAKAVRSKDIRGILAHHAPDILLFDVPNLCNQKALMPTDYRGSSYFTIGMAIMACLK